MVFSNTGYERFFLPLLGCLGVKAMIMGYCAWKVSGTWGSTLSEVA